MKEAIFVYILDLIFYGVSHGKAGLHNEYMIYNLLNLIILGVYGKR